MFSLISSVEFYNIALWAIPWIFGLLAIGVSVINQLIKPLDVSLELPGPPRLPLLEFTKTIDDTLDHLPAVIAKLSPRLSIHGGITKFMEDNVDNLPEAIAENSNKFNNRTWGGPVPFVGSMTGAFFFINDEEGIRHVLQGKFANYIKGDMWRRIWGDFLGDGMFLVDGKKWKAHRKVVSGMFSRNCLYHSATVMESKLSQVVKLFRKRLEESFFIDVDLQDYFFRITLETTLVTAFGVDLDSINTEQKHPFEVAFDEVQSLIFKRYMDPLFQLKRWSGLCPREQKIKSHIAFINTFANHVIGSKRRTTVDGLGQDLISLFLDSGEEMSNMDLCDVVKAILLASRDASASALSWTFYELLRHPEVVEKILLEVEEVCGAVLSDANYSHDNVNKLDYVHAVVLEALRLHPPVPTDIRYAANDDTLPDGTFIPARAAIIYSAYAMGRCKKLWGDDADEFKPERFYNQEHQPSAFKLVTFNAGPRTCLGQTMAMRDMKMALAILLQNLTFQDAEGHSGRYKLSMVMHMEDGFPVRVSNRRV